MILRSVMIWIALLVSSLAVSQGGFFELIPGWRASHLIEEENRLVVMALALEDFPTEHHYLFHQVDMESGLIEGTLTVDSDTIFSLSNYESPGSMIKMPDGRHLGVGSLAPETPSDIYAISYILDTASNSWDLIDWDGFSENEGTRLRIVNEINGVGYLVVGERGTVSGTDIVLLWLDSDGQFDEHQIYEYEAGQFLSIVDFVISGDDAYVLVLVNEDTPGFAPSLQYTELVKIGLDGGEQWRVSVGNPDEFLVIPGGIAIVAPDSIYVSYTYPYFYDDEGEYVDNSDQNHPMIDCISTSGALIWNHDFEGQIPPGTTVLHQMDFYEDEGILMSGWKDGGAFVAKVNHDLGIEWQHVHQYLNDDLEDIADDETELYYLIPSEYDDGYYGVGKYLSFPNDEFPEGILSAFVMRLDEYGCVLENCQSTLNEKELVQLSLFPNPAVDDYCIVPLVEDVEVLRVLDIYGRVVEVASLDAYEENYRLDTSNLNSGVYTVVLDSSSGPVGMARIMVD